MLEFWSTREVSPEKHLLDLEIEWEAGEEISSSTSRIWHNGEVE